MESKGEKYSGSTTSLSKESSSMSYQGSTIIVDLYLMEEVHDTSV